MGTNTLRLLEEQMEILNIHMYGLRVLNLGCLQADANRQPFSNGYFDMIVCVDE